MPYLQFLMYDAVVLNTEFKLMSLAQYIYKRKI